MAVQRVIEGVTVAGEIDRLAVEHEARIADAVAVRQQRKTRHAERIASGKRFARRRPQPVDVAASGCVEERRDRAAHVRCNQHAPRAVPKLDERAVVGRPEKSGAQYANCR